MDDAALAEAFPEEDPENVEEVEAAAPVEETVETEEPSEPEVTEEQPEPEEDIASKLAALEKRFSDQESFIGRQKNEIGELRALKEQYEQLREQAEQQPTVSPFETVQQWDNIDFDNPAQARNAALWLAQHQYYNYEPFMEAWAENAQNPRPAYKFELEMKEYEWQQKLQEEIAPFKGVPTRLEAEDAEKQNGQEFTKAWDALESQYPGFTEFGKEVVKDASDIPEFHNILVSTEYGAEAKQRVLETLFLAKQARRSQAEELAAAETAEAADAAKSKAKVITATSSAGTRAPAVRQTPLENLLDEAFGDLRP